jgi:hypothetical protein
MLKNVTGVKFINAIKINGKKDKNRGKYKYSVDEDTIQENVTLMLKRCNIGDTYDLKRFHERAHKYLPTFEQQYYFGTK